MDSPTAVGSDPADAATLVSGGPDADATITVAERTVAVAPGLEHTSFDTLDARGWLRGDVLTADLGSTSLTPTYLSSPSLSETGPLSGAVARAGAVAGVNGDFFDIGDTGAPLGVGIDRQEGLLHAPARNWNRTISFDAAGAAWIGRTFLEATLTMPDLEQVTIDNLNSPRVEPGGLGLYTARWGTVSRSRVVDGSKRVRRLHVVGGTVTAASIHPGRGPIPEGTTVLIGRGKGATTLKRLRRGDQVDIDYDIRSSRPRRTPVVAIGGQQVLLDNGRIVAGDDGLVAPRTAVGIDDDTNRLFLLTVDGRQDHSRGTSLRETATMLLELGADEALNLDGGGSSTMLARRAGERPRVVNRPSDGRQRNVPNGLGFRTAPGSGRLTGIQVRPIPDEPDARSEGVELLAGLSTLVAAYGHDETLSPVRTDSAWTSSRPAVVSARRLGPRAALIRSQRRGVADVIATVDGVHGTMPVTVRGRPVRVFTSTPRIVLDARGDQASFTVGAADRVGHRMEVAPRDVRLRYNHKVLQVRVSGDGFEVTARRKRGKPVITVGVGQATRRLHVRIGKSRTPVSGLGSSRGWDAAGSRTAGSALTAIPGHDARGLALDYDFTEPGQAVRAAYLEPEAPLELPSDAESLSLWVRGDGRGAQLRATVRDATGVLSAVDLSERIGFTGWRRLEAQLPEQLVRPLELVDAYVVETDESRSYRGRIVLDQLAVERAPARVPPEPLWQDPAVADAGAADRRRWSFAVLGDAEISADADDSSRVEQVREALRAMAAEDPELVFVLGDLVATAFDDDLELARQVLDEELGDIAWHYVPGELEAGDDGLAAWTAQFGDPVRTFDRRGTRFVLLDSSAGSLRLSDFDQLVELQDTLDAAASDDDVRSVVVLAHHPIQEAGEGLSDPFEADLVQDWLAQLRSESGKGAAYLSAHAGVFAADRVDGVQHLSVGQAVDATRQRGGFAGWSTVGIAGPRALRSGAPWLLTEVRPYVDALQLQAPDSVRVGRSVDVSATLRQDGRRFRVGYPMSARWTVTGGAVLDERRGVLRALRPGPVTIRVEVGDRTVEHRLRIRPRT